LSVTERFSSSELEQFVTRVLEHFDLPKADARLAASIVVDADLAGVSTHGIVNLPWHDHYVPGLRSGYVDPRAQIEVLRDAPVAAAWSSGRGFGPVVAHRAMEAAIAKAEATGIGMVTVRDARHFGANGYYAEMAARRGCMAMVTTSTMPVSFPPSGTERVVGPSPFAFAAPMKDGAPMVLDVSMTAAAGSKVLLAARAGESVPLGWVVDSDGLPTTDPSALAHGGGLELLGGETARHKGYALSLMVDTLSILAGNGPALWQDAAGGWTQGQWFAAWRADLFADLDTFTADMQRFADDIHRIPTRDGGGRLLLPGERKAACRTERGASGIPVPQDLVSRLATLATECGLERPSPLKK
jgi:LDH2 family malate/lactate/ureidoglycolate dehydrogenase